MKKILCFLLSVCLISAWNCAAFAETQNMTGWELQTSGAAFDSESNCLSLSFEAASGEEGYEAAVHSLETDEEVIAMEFTMSFEDSYSGGAVNDDSHRKGISLRNPQNPENAMDVIRLDCKKLSVFGAEPLENAELTDSVLYRTVIALNFNEKTAAVWINGKVMFSGDISALYPEGMSKDSAELYVWNSFYQRRRGAASSFKIMEMCCGNCSSGIRKAFPENNGVVQGGEKTPIVLNWGGILGGAADKSGLTAADKESFSLKQGETDVDFTVKAFGETVEITPENKLEYDKEYTLTSVSFRNALDTTDIEGVNITFRTAPENYKPPILSVDTYRGGTRITESSVTIYQSEQLSFKCSVESEAAAEKVVFDAGGSRTEASRNEEGVYEYTFTAEEEGSFDLSARAYDVLGGVSEAYELKITVAANAAPSVSFKTLSDESEISVSELSSVELEARDEDGSIDRIEIFADGSLLQTLTEPPYYADFSSVAKSRHILSAKAYDNFGASAECSVSVIVTGDVRRVVIHEENFDYYKDGLPDGMTGTVGARKDGTPILRASADYGENNTVCEWYMDRETSENVPNTWIGYDLPNSDSIVSYEYDVKFKSFPQKLYTYMLQQYYEGSSKKTVNLTDFTVEQNKFSIYNRAFPIQLETDCLYRIVYTVDVKNSRVRASVFDCDNNTFLLETPYASMRNTVRENTVINLRMQAYFNAGGETRFAIDNITVVKSLTQPIIKSIGFDENENPALIPPERASVKVFLTAPMDASKDNVKVYSGGREVSLESVEYDGAVVITFAERLKSNSTYTVELSVPWYDSSGEPVTELITCDFKTDFAEIDAADIRIDKSGGTCKVKGTLIDKNNSKGNVFAIVTIYSGKKIDRISVTKLKLLNNSEFETEAFSADETQTVDFALWKSLTMPELIANSVLQ